MKKFIPPAALAALLLLVAACGSRQSEGGSAAGSPVAAFLEESKLAGQVVLVEFGTIGCDLSNKGLDAMIDLAGRQAIADLSFARLDPVADEKAFAEYYQGKSAPFPVVRDPEMKVATALGTTVYPQFALLDRFGRARYRGAQPAEESLAVWVRILAGETEDRGSGAPMFGALKLDAAALLATTALPHLSGAVRPLASYRNRSGILLAFMDTRCPFSNVAIREFPKIVPVLQTVGIASLVVNIDEPEAAVRKTYAPDAPVVYDTGKVTQRCWNVQSVPTLVLLDSAGAVVYQGGAVWTEVAAAAAKMLGLPAGAVTLEAQSTAQG